MNFILKQMLEPYQCKTPTDYKNAFKEIIQEIALLGLSRQGFFDHASFYGGTSLRIAHGLDRFSEDLDFTLMSANSEFKLEKYLKGIEEEFVTYELKLKAEKKEKSKKTSLESAFLKGNTLEVLLLIESYENNKINFNKNDSLKIKLEIDIDPPIPSGETQMTFGQMPIPFEYRILKLPSLFSGKLHALLCRDYLSGRVKGRDYYDFAWYMKKKITPDFPYLEAKMHQSGHLEKKINLTEEKLKELLVKKFESTNWEQAKDDVIPFIKDPFALKVWSKDYFTSFFDKKNYFFSEFDK